LVRTVLILGRKLDYTTECLGRKRLARKKERFPGLGLDSGIVQGKKGGVNRESKQYLITECEIQVQTNKKEGEGETREKMETRFWVVHAKDRSPVGGMVSWDETGKSGSHAFFRGVI